MTKLTLILVALVGMMFWTLPSTTSLFTSGHDYYNTSAPCDKCHGDIRTQLEDTGIVTSMHRNLDNESGCKECHSNPNNSIGMNVTQDYHSAYSPLCMECHQNQSNALNGSQESHTVMVTGALTSTLQVGNNEACGTCHTTLLTEITLRSRAVFPFEPNSVMVNGTPEYDGTFTVTISNPVPAGLHNFNSKVICLTCHLPTYETLSQPDSPYTQHNEFGCEGCHRGNGMNATPDDPNGIYHASKPKYCSDCHGDKPHHTEQRTDCVGCHGSFTVHTEIDMASLRDCNRCHDSHGGTGRFVPQTGRIDCSKCHAPLGG